MDRETDALTAGTLSTALDDNVKRFRAILRGGVNSDAQFRTLNCAGTALCAVYLEGMADDMKLSDFALRACEEHEAPPNVAVDAQYLIENVVEIAQCEAEQRVKPIVEAVVSGRTALLIDGCDEAVLLETRGYPARQVNRTSNESVVIGAQEGFVESLRTNMTLLRRYVSSHRLITECMTVGTRVATHVAIAYLDGVARADVINAVRQRLKRIDAPSVQGLGAIQQHIEDDPWALLPQMLQTERPDRAASCLLDGQVVILADNSPCALVAPVTLFHLLHASDDSFARWQYGSFLRLIRVSGMLISVFLPGLYIALTDYHMHLLPMSLLGSISEARANVPFPILIEILIMEFSFYLINEAGTRMPQQIGSALGIVGALILGQAAVSASIISPILIIIVAITGLGNYAMPDFGFGIGLVICRLFVIFCGAALGLYGVCLAAFCLSVSLCGMQSLGCPYVAPVAPGRPHSPDLLLRLPVWLQRHPLFFAVRNSWMRTREGEGR
ncbi:MAG: spore germination protein [Clostridia bacterium]|nr:spore germination protein [Clostridia bacterium]